MHRANPLPVDKSVTIDKKNSPIVGSKSPKKLGAFYNPNHNDPNELAKLYAGPNAGIGTSGNNNYYTTGAGSPALSNVRSISDIGGDANRGTAIFAQGAGAGHFNSGFAKLGRG